MNKGELIVKIAEAGDHRPVSHGREHHRRGDCREDPGWC